MNFRASFCDPFKPDIIEMGDVDQDKIMELFNKIPWNDFIKKMDSEDAGNIFYSPSLEIECKDNKNALSVSAVDGSEWYIFFKRPKKIKTFFGHSVKVDENYLTDITGQTEEDVKICLQALIDSNLDFLEEKIK